MRSQGVSILLLCAAQMYAQWLDYPTPGIPRGKNGKPELSAPAPRGRDGKPDLSGIWIVSTRKYLENLGADGVEIPMTPWAAKLFAERRKTTAGIVPAGAACRIA